MPFEYMGRQAHGFARLEPDREMLLSVVEVRKQLRRPIKQLWQQVYRSLGLLRTLRFRRTFTGSGVLRKRPFEVLQPLSEGSQVHAHKALPKRDEQALGQLPLPPESVQGRQRNPDKPGQRLQRYVLWLPLSVKS